MPFAELCRFPGMASGTGLKTCTAVALCTPTPSANHNSAWKDRSWAYLAARGGMLYLNLLHGSPKEPPHLHLSAPQNRLCPKSAGGRGVFAAKIIPLPVSPVASPASFWTKKASPLMPPPCEHCPAPALKVLSGCTVKRCPPQLLG